MPEAATVSRHASSALISGTMLTLVPLGENDNDDESIGLPRQCADNYELKNEIDLSEAPPDRRQNRRRRQGTR
jgi:hypothetical protein